MNTPTVPAPAAMTVPSPPPSLPAERHSAMAFKGFGNYGYEQYVAFILRGQS